MGGLRPARLTAASLAALFSAGWLFAEEDAFSTSMRAMPPPRSADYASGPSGEPGGPARGDKGVPMIGNPNYIGNVIGDPRARVLMRVGSDNHDRDVRVQFRNLRIVCESGSQRVTPVPYGSSLRRDRAFESVSLLEPELGSTVLEFRLLKGRLLSRGRATGVIFDLNEVLDHPDGTRNADECWTDGVVRWKAHRVRDRGDPRSAGRSSSPARDRAARRPASVEPGRYEGKVVQRPPGKGSLTLNVNRRKGRTRMSLKTTVRLGCDAPSRIDGLGPFRMPVRGDRRFDRTFFKRDRRATDRVFTWVKGWLSTNGKAKGVFFHFEDPWDPDGAKNRAECGTPFGYRWVAERVH
jgi:hypothetical protein